MTRKTGLVLFLTFVLVAITATGAFAAGSKGKAAKKPALPAGFIALAPKPMNWNDANAYCKSKRGKLPLIANSKVIRSTQIGSSVDGFGAIGGRFPSGLPDTQDYWTGTEVDGATGYSWTVYGFYQGVFDVRGAPKNSISRVACVRK